MIEVHTQAQLHGRDISQGPAEIFLIGSEEEFPWESIATSAHFYDMV